MDDNTQSIIIFLLAGAVIYLLLQRNEKEVTQPTKVVTVVRPGYGHGYGYGFPYGGYWRPPFRFRGLRKVNRRRRR